MDKTNEILFLPDSSRITQETTVTIITDYISDSGSAIDFYDKSIPLPFHDEINEMDILSLNALNAFAGIPPMTAMDTMWQKKTSIEKFLKEVPTEELEYFKNNLDAIVKPLNKVLLEMNKVAHWGCPGTRATKLLHRLRPNTMPIWDKWIGTWYYGKDYEWNIFLNEIFKDVLRNIECLKNVKNICFKDFNISILRIWDIILWQNGNRYYPVIT
jgi:hypothetical protein